jgi:hypothetical protein
MLPLPADSILRHKQASTSNCATNAPRQCECPEVSIRARSDRVTRSCRFTGPDLPSSLRAWNLLRLGSSTSHPLGAKPSSCCISGRPIKSGDSRSLRACWSSLYWVSRTMRIMNQFCEALHYRSEHTLVKQRRRRADVAFKLGTRLIPQRKNRRDFCPSMPSTTWTNGEGPACLPIPMA